MALRLGIARRARRGASVAAVDFVMVNMSEGCWTEVESTIMCVYVRACYSHRLWYLLYTWSRWKSRRGGYDDTFYGSDPQTKSTPPNGSHKHLSTLTESRSRLSPHLACMQSSAITASPSSHLSRISQIRYVQKYSQYLHDNKNVI